MKSFICIAIFAALDCGCSSLIYGPGNEISNNDMDIEISPIPDDMSSSSRDLAPEPGVQNLSCAKAPADDQHNINVLALPTNAFLNSSCESEYSFGFKNSLCLVKLKNIKIDLDYRSIFYFSKKNNEYGTYSDQIKIGVSIKDKKVYMLGAISGFDTSASTKEQSLSVTYPWPDGVDGCIDKVYVDFFSHYDRSAGFTFPSLFNQPSVLKIKQVSVFP